MRAKAELAWIWGQFCSASHMWQTFTVLQQSSRLPSRRRPNLLWPSDALNDIMVLHDHRIEIPPKLPTNGQIQAADR